MYFSKNYFVFKLAKKNNFPLFFMQDKCIKRMQEADKVGPLDIKIFEYVSLKIL